MKKVIELYITSHCDCFKANFVWCILSFVYAYRRYMIYYMDFLMPSDVLGRRGYNDRFNTAYWI